MVGESQKGGQHGLRPLARTATPFDALFSRRRESHLPFAYWLQVAALLLAISIAVAGCVSMGISSPANNAVVLKPSPAHVIADTSDPFTGLTVSVDGTYFTGLMTSTSSTRAAGFLPLALGSHTVTASANLSCWYCSGGTSPLSAATSFVVQNPQTCVTTNNPPMITLGPNIINLGKTIGRQKIAYYLMNNIDVVEIVVDDWPGLLATQMLVSVDIDPVSGVVFDKAIDAWPFCHLGSQPLSTVTASRNPAAPVCNPLTDSDNLVSGCTTTSPPMMLDQSTTGELVLRKFLIPIQSPPIWIPVEAIDASIWQAFGGRAVRFIWRKDL